MPEGHQLQTDGPDGSNRNPSSGGCSQQLKSQAKIASSHDAQCAITLRRSEIYADELLWYKTDWKHGRLDEYIYLVVEKYSNELHLVL